MYRKFISGFNLMLVPPFYLAGQFLLSQWHVQGPDTIWFLSHILLLAGAALFVLAIAGLAQYLGEHLRVLAGFAEAVATFGVFALVGQFTIDLAVGHIASNQSEMSAAFQRIQAAPGMNLVFYSLAPICFFIGLLALVLLLTFARLIPRWTGLIALTGFIGIGLAVASSNVTIFLLGFAGLSVGLLRVGWQILSSLYARTGTKTSSTSAI